MAGAIFDVIVLIDFQAAIDEQQRQLAGFGHSIPNHKLGHILELEYF
jgi:hypothetical protein